MRRHVTMHLVRAVEPRIIGVSGGPPFDPRTSSGFARSVFEDLHRRGFLVGAVRGRPPVVDWLEKAGAFSLDRQVWRQRFFGSMTRTSPLARATSDLVASRRARGLQPQANATLQMTAWFPVGRLHDQPALLRALYIDTTGARYLERPDLSFPRAASQARRTVAFERSLFSRSDLILTTSGWTRDSVIEQYGQPADKVVVVGAGANTSAAAAPDAREWAPPKFLFVGMAWERKGGPQVLEAFASLKHRYPEAELWVVGPRDPQGEQPGVKWFGRLSRADAEQEQLMHRLFREATAFVLAPAYDPFPTVFREAMSYGLPCIGPDADAIPEMVVDGETGYTFARGDPEALLAAMQKLAESPEGALEMGRAGRARFEGNFSWAVTVERMVASIQHRLL